MNNTKINLGECLLSFPHTYNKENQTCYKNKKKSCRIDAMKLREIGFECSPPL